ncbi:hypothetical protein [Fibrella aquatica]|jgi:hypothetical protein|uniref:hypothetical protein n=1 Tax=Fibrella aquatica TaxID=3242487 RepID=UPI00351FF838
MAQDYRSFGFTVATPELVDPLKQSFDAWPHRGPKTGTFIGINQLKSIVDSLTNLDLNGIQICYGLGNSGDGDQVELVITEVRVEDIEVNDTPLVTVIRTGQIYASVDGDSPEPPGLGCPPLICSTPPRQVADSD